MNVFKLDFRGSVRSMLLWSGIIALVLILFMSFFPSMANESMKEITTAKIKALPPGLLRALGLEYLPDFTNIVDYFAYMFQFIILAGAVYAALLGTSALIKEETDGTIEYLYAQPVTRSSIVGQKLLSTLASYIAFVFITGAISAVLITVFLPQGANLIEALMQMKTILAGMIFTGLIFLCVGLLISTVVRSDRQSTPIGVGMVLITYVIGLFAGAFSTTLEQVKVLKYLSPVGYSMPLDVVKKGFDGVSIAIGILAIVVSTAAAFVIYQRKDLRS